MHRPGTPSEVPHRQRNNLFRFAWLCAVLLLGVCTIAGAQQLPQQAGMGTITRSIQGTVRTATGQRVGMFAKVQLEGEDGGMVGETLTDSDGQYSFAGLTGRAFRLIVTAPGYERHEEMIPSSVGIQLTIVNVTMKPSAEDAANAAISESRTDALAPKDARKKYDKALKALAAQQPDKAKPDLESAVQLYPCYASAQAHLATVLEAAQDPAGAEAALKKAIQCDPDYISPYSLLGQFLNGRKRFSDSVPVLEAGERRSPKSWTLCYELGIAYFGVEQYAKAEGEYKKVPELSSSPPPDLPLRLADVYAKEQDYDKAYAEMREYLKAQPNGPYAAKVRGIVQQVDASGLLKPQN